MDFYIAIIQNIFEYFIATIGNEFRNLTNFYIVSIVIHKYYNYPHCNTQILHIIHIAIVVSHRSNETNSVESTISKKFESVPSGAGDGRG